METLVHATDPEKSIGRILPRDQASGGSIVLHEYDHPDFKRSSQSLSKRTLTSRWNISTREHRCQQTSLSYKGGPAAYARKTRLLQDVVVEDQSEKHQTYGAGCSSLWDTYRTYLIICLLGTSSLVREHSGGRGTGLVVYSPPFGSHALSLHRPTQIIQYTNYLLI